MRKVPTSKLTVALAFGLAFGAGATAQAADCPNCLRDLAIGVSVVPPNVVHTTPYIAK